MSEESRQVSKEYVFWFHVIRRNFAYYFLNTPKQLAKVVVDENRIFSNEPIWTNRQDVLNIALRDVAQIKPSISATAQNGGIEIVTQEYENYLLVPTSPFDPTLLSHSNIDEVMAFIYVVEALKASRNPNVDENPYIRQFSKKNEPAYLKNKIDFLWDKNVSPWKYYYEFVPASVDKKKHNLARIYKIIVFIALIVMFLALLYVIYVQLKKW
jgi:hypothetical protein